MTSFSAPPKFSRQILMLTAGIFLLGATEGALAKNGGNSNDHGSMRNGDSAAIAITETGTRRSMRTRTQRFVRFAERCKGGDKRSENHKDKGKEEDKHAEKNKDKDRDGDKHAEKTKDKDKDKTAGTTTTANGNTPAAGTARSF